MQTADNNWDVSVAVVAVLSFLYLSKQVIVMSHLTSNYISIHKEIGVWFFFFMSKHDCPVDKFLLVVYFKFIHVNFYSHKTLYGVW